MTDSSTAHPFVSVIMPVRNEERFIHRSLGAVLAQDYPADRYEVLIADGMSTDQTRQIVKEISDGRAVSIVDNPGRTAPTGLNAGIAAAIGEIIARVDGHTEIASDYLSRCVAALVRTGADNVGGPINSVGDNRFGRAVALATSSPAGMGGSAVHYAEEERELDTVYLGCFWKSLFDRIGGFDEELRRNQDDEFNYRIRSNGGRVVLVPGITSEYHNRTSPLALWRHYWGFGFWKVRVIQKLPDQARLRHLIPAGFVSTIVTSAVLGAIWVESLYFLAGLLAVYLIAISAAAIAAAGRRSPQLVPETALAMAIVHLAYGSGFIAGFVRFIGRWRQRKQVTA